MGRTAPLISKRYILYIYSTNIGTEYFKLSAFFSSKCSLFHDANLFASFIIHILYTGCAEIKKNNSGAKGLTQFTICIITIDLDLIINYMNKLVFAVNDMNGVPCRNIS